MSVLGGPDMITDGLVLYLDAANSRSYPGSGISWSDISGTSVNGSLTNGPTFSSENGGSINFDGSNDYVDVAWSSALAVGSNYTLEIVMRNSSLGTGFARRTIATKDTVAGNALQLGTIGFSGSAMYWLRRGGTADPQIQMTGSTGIANNEICHIVATFNGTTHQGYINGTAYESLNSWPIAGGGFIYE